MKTHPDFFIDQSFRSHKKRKSAISSIFETDIFGDTDIDIYHVSEIAGLLARHPVELNKQMSHLRIFLDIRDPVLRNYYNSHVIFNGYAKSKNRANINIYHMNNKIKLVDIDSFDVNCKMFRSSSNPKDNKDKEYDRFIFIQEALKSWADGQGGNSNVLKIFYNAYRYGVGDILLDISIPNPVFNSDFDKIMVKAIKKHIDIDVDLSGSEYEKLRDYLLAANYKEYHFSHIDNGRIVVVLDNNYLKFLKDGELIAVNFNSINLEKNKRRTAIPKKQKQESLRYHNFEPYLSGRTKDFDDNDIVGFRGAIQYSLLISCFTEEDIIKNIGDRAFRDIREDFTTCQALWTKNQLRLGRNSKLSGHFHHFFRYDYIINEGPPGYDPHNYAWLWPINLVLHEMLNGKSESEQIEYLLASGIMNKSEAIKICTKAYLGAKEYEEKEYDGPPWGTSYLLEELGKWIVL